MTDVPGHGTQETLEEGGGGERTLDSAGGGTI